MARTGLNFLNGLISALVTVALLVTALYAGFALWDNHQIYHAAESVFDEMKSIKAKMAAQAKADEEARIAAQKAAEEAARLAEEEAAAQAAAEARAGRYVWQAVFLLRGGGRRNQEEFKNGSNFNETVTRSRCTFRTPD